jgi:hypothetical protein
LVWQCSRSRRRFPPHSAHLQWHRGSCSCPLQEDGLLLLLCFIVRYDRKGLLQFAACQWNCSAVLQRGLIRRDLRRRDLRNRQGDVRARVRRICPIIAVLTVTTTTILAIPCLSYADLRRVDNHRAFSSQILFLLEARFPSRRAEAHQLQRARYARCDSVAHANAPRVTPL